MELFTGTPQDQDWIDLVCKGIEQTQPMFFASARSPGHPMRATSRASGSRRDVHDLSKSMTS
jgi:hypothetical protein